MATPASPEPAAVEAELDRLAQLDLAGLRIAFRNRTGRIAPDSLSRALLGRVLAYRVQVEAWGDLRSDTRRRLERVGKPPSGSAAEVSRVEMAPALKLGTELVREWRGRLERVTMHEGGFAWNGQVHASLSAVAFAITGTKWNGHRFFGLRKPEKRR